VLYLHNSSANARPLKPAGSPDHHAWAAEPDACPDGAAGGCAALALFNAGNKTSQVVVNLTALRLGDGPQLCGRNLWTRRPLKPTSVVDVFAPKVRCCAFAWCSARLLTLRATLRSCRRTAPRCTCSGAPTTARRAKRCSQRRAAAVTERAKDAKLFPEFFFPAHVSECCTLCVSLAAAACCARRKRSFRAP
jgi:hypothetical protein